MKLALFGSPVAHSLSPAMHQAALSHVGVAGSYEAREVDLAGFLAGLVEIRDGRLYGANVTMPYKQSAFEIADRTTARARQVGAVNTLVMGDGGLVGDNTDIDGVRSAWAVAGLPTTDEVVILGAGGASAAAQVALANRSLYVVARRPEQAQEVVRRVGGSARVIAWGDPVPAGVVVNATSLGMKGEKLPSSVMAAASGLLDMAYGDRPTRSVQRARDRGIPVADGLDMLVGQAVASFRVWTEIAVEAEVFRRAAEQELLKRSR